MRRLSHIALFGVLEEPYERLNKHVERSKDSIDEADAFIANMRG